MSLADLSSGLRSLLGGDFGEHWVHVTASGSGVLHERSSTVDLTKADISLTWNGEAGGWRNPKVDVQVKTTVDLRRHGPNHWAYDLDVDTYEALRHTNYQTRRILAVIGLSEDGDTLDVRDDGTLLVGHSTWVSLEDLGPTTNATTQVVYLPRAHVLDLDGYRAMLTKYGVPRSSQVPEVDEWGDDE